MNNINTLLNYKKETNIGDYLKPINEKLKLNDTNISNIEIIKDLNTIKQYIDIYDISFNNWSFTTNLWNIWIIPEIIILIGLLLLIAYIAYIIIIKGAIEHTEVKFITIWIFKMFYILILTTAALAWLLAIYKKTIFYKNFLVFNFFSLFSKVLINVLTLCVLYMLKLWYIRSRRNVTEIYILISGSTFFGYLLSSSTNLFLTYITLESLSMQSYTMAIYTFSDVVIDVVLKYFLLGGLASGILLYGISLIYGTMNTLNYFTIKNTILEGNTIALNGDISTIAKLGTVLILFGLLFKLGAYPMHLWVPSVYSNSPNPITTYFATTIKIIITTLLMRITFTVFDTNLEYLKMFLLISAIGSIIAGAIGAFKELKIKNFIAYTAVNQVGFTMLGLACQTSEGLYYAIYYLFIYITLTLGFLMLIFNINQTTTQKNARFFKDLRHICKNSIYTGIILSMIVLSFAGLPPFAGFFGKLYIYYAIAKSGMLLLLFISIFANIVSLYYYVRVIKSMWFENLVDSIDTITNYRLTESIPIKIIICIISIFNLFFLSLIPSFEKLVETFYLSMLLIN